MACSFLELLFLASHAFGEIVAGDQAGRTVLVARLLRQDMRASGLAQGFLEGLRPSLLGHVLAQGP